MPNQPRRDYSTKLARQNRGKLTPEEAILWARLKGRRGPKFRRQVAIGPYIVDFACYSHKLIIEADGTQHGGEYDETRDAWLRYRGWRILRFANHDIRKDTEFVVMLINLALDSPSP